MIEHPRGGVIILGGINDADQSNFINYRLLHLPSASDKSWVILPQRLNSARYHMAVLGVPDSTATCA